MPAVFQLPRSYASAVLYTHCCTLLGKTNAQLEKHGTAKAWLRRAMEVQGDLGLDVALANSLQLEATILSCEGKHALAKESLQGAESIVSGRESDECLRCKLQVDIAIAEIELGECDPARARLTGLLPTLRRRKRDRFSLELLPVAARALSRIVTPKRRLRRKSLLESIV